MERMETVKSQFTMMKFLFIYHLSIHDCNAIVPGIKSFNSGNHSHPFHQILIHDETGDVYIGGTNSLLHLDLDLLLIKNLNVGPEKDEVECPPNPLTCTYYDRVSTDNEIKILLLGDYQTKLIYCGSINQGMCEITDSSSLTRGTTIGVENDSTNYISGKRSVFAFFSRGPRGRTLYSAVTYDGRPFYMFPYNVASRKLVAKGLKYHWEYAVNSNRGDDISIAGVKFKNEYQSNFIVNYVYGFTYGNFSYFVITQKVNISSSEYETRLIRIHQFDSKFFSYSEIPIMCQNNRRRIASAAYFGPFKPYLLVQNAQSNYLHDTHALYLSFGPSNGKRDSNCETDICVFPISRITESFTFAMKECLGTDKKIKPIPWIQGFNQFCSSYKAIQIDDDFIGSGLNMFIQGMTGTSGFFLTVIPKQVTAVAISKQNESIVGFFGTRTGELLKYRLRFRGSLLLTTVSLASDVPIQYRAVHKAKAFDSNENNLYLMTGSKVTKVPVRSCVIYSTCEVCAKLGQNEPLGCGWCGTYCSHKDECNNVSIFRKNSCPPIIKEFSPSGGPLEGGTEITIKGNYFGSNFNDDVQLNVYIGHNECVIKDGKWEMDKIVCVTKPVGKPFENVISVFVSDPSRVEGFEILGRVYSQQTFSYIKSSAYKFYPTYGPFAGGTNLTIYGHNLLSGAKRIVWVVGTVCKEYKITPEIIECTTGNMVISDTSGASETYYSVYIEIDDSAIQVINDIGTPEIFTYKQNPVIKRIKPGASVLSGGVIITISGENLNSVANPRMIVRATIPPTNLEVMEFIKPCISDSSFSMRCSSPNLTLLPYLSDETDKKFPLRLHLSFIMDGVTSLRNLYATNESFSRFLYYPDPVYKRFHNQSMAKDEQLLLIEGKHLNLVHQKEDVKVIIDGNRTCLVQELTANHLKCKLPNGLGEEFRVEVISCNLTFDLGYRKYSSVAANINNVILLSLFAVLVIVVLTCFYQCHTKCNCGYFWKIFKDKKDSGLAVWYISTSHQEDLDVRISDEEPCGSDYIHLNSKRQQSLVVSDGQKYDETVRQFEAEKILFRADQLQIGSIIGQGHFGCVHHGILRLSDKDDCTEVAVKTINQDHSGEYDIEGFLDEALMMKNFHHHNVLKLVGVCVQLDGTPIVITPYMKHGDLLSYIRNEYNHPTVEDLVNFGIQIAKGMEYLSGLKFVHRDLAGRNCMLNEDLTVKVADFGLSREVYKSAYYSSDNNKTELPVRWMAPESLEKGQYSTKSDTWSFGIVLWELLTRGVCPYPEVGNWDIVRYLNTGRRMPKPVCCPDSLYEVMLQCWRKDYHARPTFTDLVDRIESIIRSLEKSGHQKSKTVPYVNHPLPGDINVNDEEPEIKAINYSLVVW